MKKYALKSKTSFQFACVSDTIEAFEKRVQKAFYSWKACQAYGNTKTMEDFMSSFDKVVVEIEVFH